MNVDELFNLSTNKGKTETIVTIPIKEISDSPEHPFRITDDEEMQQMVENIKENGVNQPVIVRPKEDGGYEIVDGRRRKRASQLAGKNEIPAIVRNLTRDEAIILMVDANIFQREKILPSERAFAYKMKMEAMKRQGKRVDLTSDQVGWKSKGKETAQIIGEKNGDSQTQVRRYIRLTELIKELLFDMVDTGKIAFNPAVELSYLTKTEQNVVLDCIKQYDATPSQAQAIRMKELSKEGKLTASKIEEILSEEKPNQKMKYQIDYGRFEKYLPRNVVTPKEVEDFLYDCAKEHYKREKQREIAR